ncbi:MAG: rhamnan synthesis F family protein [Succinivibrionaceae bacterium]|nr:rhamnan synthesis F family protein [Succinivibrionaceae bacterium]
MKRLSLYVFYEKNGRLRDSDKYYLKGLKAVSEPAVIVNGHISEDGLEFLNREGYSVLCRNNIGFDFAAWKEYFEKNPDALLKYDEVILCNCSCFGPVFPLAGVFRKMEGVRCDLWGLCRHPGEEGRFPPHLQSYFLVIRSRLLRDSSFADYFRELKSAADWDEAVGQETHFTEYFENKGFISASFIDGSLSEIYPDPSIILPEKLLERGFPFVKRKVFSADYGLIQSYTDGTHIRALLDFLKNRTGYPLDLIRKDAVRSMPNSVIRNIFHLTFVVDSASVAPGTRDSSSSPSVSAIVYSYYEDLIDHNLWYLASLPIDCSLYIVVVSEKMRSAWNERLRESGRKYEVRIQANRGRNEAAYWLTCRDVIEKSDYICLLHDKKTPSAKPPVKGLYFNEHCWKNVLFSPQYVQNIIALFESRPELGILMPTVPMFAEWPDLIMNREWAGDRDAAMNIFERLGLSVTFDEHPAAPWGAMFWVRGRAMAAFYRHDWTIGDFPEEPLKDSDGTVLHALERMYPMIAQESGFFSGWIIPSDLAGTYYDNLYARALAYRRETVKGFLEHPDSGKIHFSTVKKVLFSYIRKKLKGFIP